MDIFQIHAFSLHSENAIYSHIIIDNSYFIVSGKLHACTLSLS